MAESTPLEPAGYSDSSTSEMIAIVTWLNLLDLKYVKPDARWLDKVPNNDGTVEIVDDRGIPDGILNVQIKTLPSGTMTFNCPVELVAYSTRLSSPFILICVDAVQKRAYWRWLHEGMPEFKKGQKTFSIHFRAEVDEVGPGKPYVRKWGELCSEFKRRVSEYPRLADALLNEIGLSSVPVKERLLFQAFVDEFNHLLDIDFPVVKDEFFADTWKVGVQIHSLEVESIDYSIYTIKKGENAPLITHQSVKSSNEEGMKSKQRLPSEVIPLVYSYSNRDHFSDGSGPARECVFSYIKRALDQKLFRACSLNQCIEQLRWFVKRYGMTLGLPDSNEYKVEDIVYGLNVFLPAWYAITLSNTIRCWSREYPDALAQVGLPFFEHVANSANKVSHPSKEQVISFIAKNEFPSNLYVRSNDFSYRKLLESADFLSAGGIITFSDRCRPRSQQGKWIWEWYAFEDIVHNAKVAYEDAVADFSTFIEGNRFGRLKSRFTDRRLSLVAVISKSEDKTHEPLIDQIWVENSDEKLQPLTLIDHSAEPDAFVDHRKSVIVRGIQRKCVSGSKGGLDFLWAARPVETLLYKWLRQDLSFTYKERF